MTGTTTTKEQRPAVMPLAALVVPVVLGNCRRRTTSWAGGSIATLGFTANQPTRLLGRPST